MERALRNVLFSEIIQVVLNHEVPSTLTHQYILLSNPYLVHFNFLKWLNYCYSQNWFLTHESSTNVLVLKLLILSHLVVNLSPYKSLLLLRIIVILTQNHYRHHYFCLTGKRWLMGPFKLYHSWFVYQKCSH